MGGVPMEPNQSLVGSVTNNVSVSDGIQSSGCWR